MNKKLCRMIAFFAAFFIFLSVAPAYAEPAQPTYEQFCDMENEASSCDCIFGGVYSTELIYRAVANILRNTSPWKEKFVLWDTVVEVPAADFEGCVKEYFLYKKAGALDALLADLRENAGRYNKEKKCYIIYPGGIGDAPNTFLGYKRSGSEYAFWFAATDYTETGVVVKNNGNVIVLKYENDHICYVDSYKFTAKDIPAVFDEAPEFSSPVLGDCEDFDERGSYYDAVEFFSDEYFPKNTSVNVGFYTAEVAAEDPSMPVYKLADGQNKAVYITVAAYNSAVEGEIQPKAPVTLDFKLPDGYSHNIRCYRLVDGKAPEELPVAVDIANGKISVTFAHFSYYVLAFSDPAAGDIDGDKKVSAADARLALRAAVGLEKYEKTSSMFASADVNHDGKVASDDARLILRASVGLEKF